MRALLDVNVLIALLDADHSLHTRATSWFSVSAGDGWASCPITQNGCVRIMSHPRYSNPLPVPAVMQRLAEAVESDHHEFWSDDVSLLDAKIADPARIHSARQLTDIYLLALAVRHNGRFVTFDGSISIEAVQRAQKTHLVNL